MYSNEELVHRIGELGREKNDLFERAVAAEAKVVRLTLERDAERHRAEGLRADAERYRWLRKNEFIIDAVGDMCDGTEDVETAEDMDRVIDEARTPR